LRATSIPTDKAAGKNGGIMIEKRSTNLMMISFKGMIFNYWGSVIKNPITARIPMLKINFKESAKNLNFVGFGNSIDFINSPLVVLNPVLITKAVTGSFE